MGKTVEKSLIEKEEVYRIISIFLFVCGKVKHV